ncbi:hypothetical protein A8C75_06975 [Marinobacterium aestuarii]|uniref:Branched-chain amino acid ABC transporter permease n=1 Tax=Marinobacterium aestuarii TaxID=1821621 RepID=A0A1A9F4J5_9GAMM|nr:AzlC family ABC transporter permease [Marinobacterium aestuarii]ANG65137.1 hypothetical protein A8C75_06975 [Marinobacterium aestuarii]
MTPARLFLTGARDTLPLILAAIPFGIVYGALATSNGLSQWATLAISLFVYAGSAQFIAVTLLASAAALPVILLTVFVVNLRHMLYAAMVVAFIGIVVPALQSRAQWACAFSAGVCSLLTWDWPHQSGLLLTALVAITVGGVLERRDNKASNLPAYTAETPTAAQEEGSK